MSATQPAAAQAMALPATQPMSFTNLGMLPEAECWWTQSGPNSTTVWHYVPLSASAGMTLGFVVPSFMFDDDHMAIDKDRELLYIIHEGQLFALPIPKKAMRPQ